MITAVAILAVCVILTFLWGCLVGWLLLPIYERLTGQPARTLRPRPAPPAPPTPSLDVCEVCGAAATHELAGGIEFAAGEAQAWSACVACYCKDHAPVGAIQVR